LKISFDVMEMRTMSRRRWRWMQIQIYTILLPK